MERRSRPECRPTDARTKILETGVIMFREIAARGAPTKLMRPEWEGYFRRLVENAPEMIVVAEADGTLRYANPATERILGQAPEELVGTKSYNHIHPEDSQNAARSFAEAMSDPGGSAVFQEIRCRHADGSWRFLEGFAHNLLHDRYVRGVLLTARDKELW
jgi:PAS domain S-box-containing protein